MFMHVSVCYGVCVSVCVCVCRSEVDVITFFNHSFLLCFEPGSLRKLENLIKVIKLIRSHQFS